MQVVCYAYSGKTSLRIFLILCMHIPYHKGVKCTRPFFQERSCSLIINENSFFAFFSTLLARINSISHNMVVLNVSQHMTVFIGHALLMKYAQCLQIVQKGQKMAKKGQKNFFGHFLEFGVSV